MTVIRGRTVFLRLSLGIRLKSGGGHAIPRGQVNNIFVNKSQVAPTTIAQHCDTVERRL